jgi:hypothetical protein
VSAPQRAPGASNDPLVIRVGVVKDLLYEATAVLAVGAAGLTASWSGGAKAAGDPAYAPVYQVLLTESTGVDRAFYVGTDRQFVVESAVNGAPLLPGTYTGSLVGFSGAYSAGGGFQVPNNITGSNVTGVFFSLGSAVANISFAVQ